MKNTKVIALVALLAVLVGLVGMIVCIVPGQSKPDSTINAYVSAINAGNTEKMHKLSAASVLTDLIGSQFADIFSDDIYNDSIEDVFGATDANVSADNLYLTLQNSAFSGFYLSAEEITSVDRVKVVGCVDGEDESYMGLSGLTVTVVLQIDYTDAEGNSDSIYSTEDIGLLFYDGKYYIGG